MTTRQRATTANRKIASTGLSQTTAVKLKKLLVYMAKQEMELELQRQFLAANENFEPYTVFQRIDRGEDGFITPMELLNFLRDNSIHHITEAECYYVVKFFDSDEDGKLNYPDFMQMVLPCDNNMLRSTATQRPNMYIAKDDFLTIDIERDMTKLIMAEVDMHSKSEQLKQELECMVDFTGDGAYKSIDDWGYGFVDPSNLKGFLRNNKHLATDEECFAVIRRMDCDADSKLTIQEFIDGIKPQEPYSKMLVRDRLNKIDEKKRIKKQNKIDLAKGKRVNKKKEDGTEEDAIRVQALDKDYPDLLSTSPLKYRVKMDLSGSPSKKPEKEEKELKSIMKSTVTPSKKSVMSQNKSQISSSPPNVKVMAVSNKKVSIMEVKEKDDYGSPNKMKQSMATMAGSQFKSPSVYQGSGRGVLDSGADFNLMDFHESQFNQQDNKEIEKQLVNIFREQLEMERNLERAKIDLSLRTDFNLIDAFRIFDQDGKGWITASELKEGLTNFNIFAQPEDIGFFIKRYDKDEDGRLKYSEFCDSFLPTDQFHASLLAKKAPLSMYQVNMTPDKIFYPQTKQMLVETWNTHIQNERQAEQIRLNLQCVEGFSPYNYFHIVDFKGDGVIDREEIKELLAKYNYYVSEREICALIDRYDRKRDGRINYSEFVDELVPRSNIARR